MREATSSVSVGYENLVARGRIVAIVDPKSAPIKRMVREAGEKGLLIDATCGKPTRSAIVMDSGNVVLSAVSPGKIGARLDRTKTE
jgi:hypothetical protein